MKVKINVADPSFVEDILRKIIMSLKEISLSAEDIILNDGKDKQVVPLKIVLETLSRVGSFNAYQGAMLLSRNGVHNTKQKTQLIDLLRATEQTRTFMQIHGPDYDLLRKDYISKLIGSYKVAVGTLTDASVMCFRAELLFVCIDELAALEYNIEPVLNDNNFS